MDPAAVSLQSVLIVLACAVAAVVACRSLRLPAIIGYLVTGLALGPHALRLMSPERGDTRLLAEIGVVFLMFSIGLEFSLPRLMAMRRVVFGLGLAQVAATIAIVMAIAAALGWGWQAGLALGGIVAMSSTAIVSKLLAERLELDSPHGREIIGVLLFQDLAVVPLLVVVPALGQPGEQLGTALAIAFGKAVAALSMVIVAFLAGMLISETEYRFQVEEDIKPFRDVLLGLFFITVGMMLDLRLVAEQPGVVAALFVALVVGKALIVAL